MGHVFSEKTRTLNWQRVLVFPLSLPVVKLVTPENLFSTLTVLQNLKHSGLSLPLPDTKNPPPTKKAVQADIRAGPMQIPSSVPFYFMTALKRTLSFGPQSNSCQSLQTKIPSLTTSFAQVVKSYINTLHSPLPATMQTAI